MALDIKVYNKNTKKFLDPINYAMRGDGSMYVISYEGEIDEYGEQPFSYLEEWYSSLIIISNGSPQADMTLEEVIVWQEEEAKIKQAKADEWHEKTKDMTADELIEYINSQN
jgi:protein associated with RNAse G/E